LSSSTFKCSCPTGYTGDECEIKIDSCFLNNCQNNSTCVAQSNSSYFW
jgi:hypothetical protein